MHFVTLKYGPSVVLKQKRKKRNKNKKKNENKKLRSMFLCVLSKKCKGHITLKSFFEKEIFIVCSALRIYVI